MAADIVEQAFQKHQTDILANNGHTARSAVPVQILSENVIGD
jgi:hypothetical protein